MNWLRRFMIGRYGSDQLNMAMLIASLILILFSQLTGWGLFYTLAFVIMVLCYVRMFSRNVSKRYQENLKFLQFWNPMRQRFSGLGGTFRDARTHCHFKCPSCGQKVRVPRGRGKVSISCPKCGLDFIKKT